jgi:hypothetical protein
LAWNASTQVSIPACGGAHRIVPVIRGVTRCPLVRTGAEDMSPNFAQTAFWEVRYPLAITSNGKDTPFGSCARTHDCATVPPNSGRRL